MIIDNNLTIKLIKSFNLKNFILIILKNNILQYLEV